MIEMAQLPSDPLIGQTLVERYRLHRKIGEGGMGAVYEAVHIQLEKPVAIKVLRDKYLDRPEAAQRLVKEARLASSIRHEHIIEITDSGSTNDGRTFVVMEHLEGRSLSELIRSEGALPEGRAIAIVHQAAVALGAAHERGIIHRDVKPENIFLIERYGQRDFVKVVDFGISKSVHESTDQLHLTQTGMVLGTPLYMSPEQARGDDDLDHRIDVYALGVILFESLTGEVPFRGTNSLGIISQILNREPPRPRALRPDLVISEGVDEVVMRAIAKPRELRYPSMAALVVDLERALAGELVDKLPSPPSSQSRRFKTIWTTAGLLLGGAALGLGLRATRARPPLGEAKPVLSVPVQSSPLPSQTVVVHVESDPPGAEIRQGQRVFGPAPRDLVLPRSPKPLRLTFFYDGYDPSSVEVLPTADDSLRVRLHPQTPSRHRSKSTSTPARSTGSPPPEPHRPAGPSSETLPNPY